MSYELGEYKGYPTIKLIDDEDTNDKKYNMTFGMRKAKLILAHIDAIQKFVAEAKPKPKEDF